MKIAKEDRKFPVLLAFELEDRRQAVWCPYCVKFHYHGTGEGHRVAHCDNPESPFLHGGYVIKKGSRSDLVKEHFRNKIPESQRGE